MEVRELMIGDYVSVPSELNRIKRIQSTFDMDEAVLYRPIKLTIEILEKNSFSHLIDDKYLWYNDLECIMVDPDSGYVKIFSKKYDSRFDGFCHDVHELQHAIRLCKIDKEIIL